MKNLQVVSLFLDTVVVEFLDTVVVEDLFIKHEKKPKQ